MQSNSQWQILVFQVLNFYAQLNFHHQHRILPVIFLEAAGALHSENTHAQDALSLARLCGPVDWSPPGSAIRRISRQEYWRVAISFSRGSSHPRDQTGISCIGTRIPYHWVIREALISEKLSAKYSSVNSRSFPGVILLSRHCVPWKTVAGSAWDVFAQVCFLVCCRSASWESPGDPRVRTLLSLPGAVVQSLGGRLNIPQGAEINASWHVPFICTGIKHVYSRTSV